MKRLLPILTILAAATCAHATVYFNEPFDYANGNLTSNPEWSTHSGTAGQIQVDSQTIVIKDSQSEDANRQIGTTITAGSIFGGFDFSVTAPSPASGSDFEYFASFGNGTSDFTSRMDITAAGDTGDFRVGISGTSGEAQATWPTDLTYGTTYRAMIGYNRDNGISTLWIDPATEGSSSIVSLADTNDVTGFYFRESNSSVNETIVVDNLIVASTFDEALPVPEPSIALLGGFGLLGLIRRRR